MKQAELSKNDEKFRKLFDAFKGVENTRKSAYETNDDRYSLPMTKSHLSLMEKSNDLQVESFTDDCLLHEIQSCDDHSKIMNESTPMAQKGLLGHNSSLLTQI